MLARRDRLDPRHPPDGRCRGRPLLGRVRARRRYYERGLNRWDLAAGALIAAEAGATIGELDDGTVIAAPPALFDGLRDAVAAAGS